MGNCNKKSVNKNNLIKSFFVFLLTGIIVFTGFATVVSAQSPYDTNFDWHNTEEEQNEWPLDPSLTGKTHIGIGTAGFSYSRFYYNDNGQIVLEFDISIFPDDSYPTDFNSNIRTFRKQWDNALIFIDPSLIQKVDLGASFFMMSYPIDKKKESLNSANISGPDNNIFKLSVNKVFPKMPTGSDYMKSKLYLVLNSGITRESLNEDYAIEMRYTNNQGQVYDQKGSKGSQVIGDYYGHVISHETYDVSLNNDDVTLKTIAPFQTASMPNTIPNPVLPPDMMRTVGQSVIYDNISGTLNIYYKQAPNHYIYTEYANNGYFLSSWLGIRQVMDSRIYDALKPDENGVVGYMRMFDLDGKGSGWNVTTEMKNTEFSYSQTTTNVGTYSYMLVPKNFKTNIVDKATVLDAQTNNVKNVYLHGHKKESDYVRFIYYVDKNKMDALFGQVNSSTLSISTSYISDRPTETTQTEYRLMLDNDIVIPQGAKVIFELPTRNSRAIFKAGLGNNYERIIGELQTKRTAAEIHQYGVDPTDYGKAYTIAPYVFTSDGFILDIEAGIKVFKNDGLSLTVFDSNSPETIDIKVIDGTNTTTYTLNKYGTNENKLYTMPNANVRTGIIINRSANTPHVNEFFTDSTTISGHSKYPFALVSIRKAVDDEVFKETYSSTTSEAFDAEGITYDGVNAGYPFTLDIPLGSGMKKDMEIRFSNAAVGYFRSIPATYRAQAKITFDFNDGSALVENRIVPINENAMIQIINQMVLKDLIFFG